MHKRFANMHMGGGFPKGNFPRGFGFDDDPFNDDFFKMESNLKNRMNMNRDNFGGFQRNQNFEEDEEPKTKVTTYVLDGKKITRTEEPYYEDDGTVKTHVIEENEDGEVVDYFE